MSVSLKIQIQTHNDYSKSQDQGLLFFFCPLFLEHCCTWLYETVQQPWQVFSLNHKIKFRATKTRRMVKLQCRNNPFAALKVDSSSVGKKRQTERILISENFMKRLYMRMLNSIFFLINFCHFQYLSTEVILLQLLNYLKVHGVVCIKDSW